MVAGALRRNVHERGGFAKRDAVNNGFHVERALTLMLSIGGISSGGGIHMRMTSWCIPPSRQQFHPTSVHFTACNRPSTIELRDR
jgi:hypothetical protein